MGLMWRCQSPRPPAANIIDAASAAAPEAKGFSAVQLMLLPTGRLLPPPALLLLPQPPPFVHSPIFIPLRTLQNLTTSNAAVAITPPHAATDAMTSL